MISLIGFHMNSRQNGYCHLMSRAERFTFTGKKGDLLAARIDRPAGPAKAYALFAHCFTCTKDIFAANRIAQGLVAAGIAVLRFDFTGLGASEGEFANTNFSSNVDDLVAAADHMREHLSAPDILIGHSLGGAAVLVAAGRIPECRAVATLGAPADPAHVSHLFQNSLEEIEASGEAKVLLAGRPFQIRKQFLDDIRGQNIESELARLNRALLIIHAPLDQTVGIENAGRIFQAAKHPKSFISLDDADHLISRKQDAVYVAEIIAAWAGRYVGAASDETHPVPDPVKGTVAVSETGKGKFANSVVTGSGHLLRADEPVSVGGDDTGPTPYDFLLAALGSCKSMTMRMYADHKGYALDHAEVRLSHDRIHAEDCETCATKSGKIDRIKTSIHLKGNLSEDERQKIYEIAERCPVHRTVVGEIIIDTELEN